MKAINMDQLKDIRTQYEADRTKRIVRNALTKNDISTVSRVFEAEAANPNIFSINLKTMSATNQMASGRCWLFSALNVLRETVAKKCNMDEFELSQNYPAFYDKLEKSNWFMECTLQEIDNPLDCENMRYLMANPVGDGGQWNMVQSLIRKYGVVPKTAMPETYQSFHTRNMNAVLNKRLRRFVVDSRKAHQEGKDISKIREQALKEIYGFLASCFGLPPQEFTFQYVDKEGNTHARYHMTPQQFYDEYVGIDMNSLINCINGPTHDKPYYRNFTVRYLGNVVDGNPISLLNIPMEEMKQAIIQQLKDGEPVWFGCDCGKDGDRETGLWDDQQYDYEGTFGMTLSMSKAEMLDYGQSAMNHAMVITGVNLDENGKPDRWKIENSWGDKAANKGYFIASDSWFDQYVYVAAVYRTYLSKEALSGFEKETIELQPWDPFGTLAE